MIGALIAGGASTRLPGKLAARVGGRTLVEHGLDLLRQLGCQRVLIVAREGGVSDLLAAAPRAAQVAFLVQPDGAERGIATAVAAMEPWAPKGAEAFLVLLADNLFGDLDELRCAARAAMASWRSATIMVREDPRAVEHTVVRFGPEEGEAPEYQAAPVESIEEKPGRAPREGDFVQVGLYAYRGPAIFRAIARCAVSPRGEVEIADAHRMLWQQGDLDVGRIRGPWTDVNTPEALATAEESIWI